MGRLINKIVNSNKVNESKWVFHSRPDGRHSTTEGKLHMIGISEFENSRLEFGKTITNHLKCELLSTNKQKWWVDEIKHFHSQNEKKDEKTEKNKKDAELLS